MADLALASGLGPDFRRDDKVGLGGVGAWAKGPLRLDAARPDTSARFADEDKGEARVGGFQIRIGGKTCLPVWVTQLTEYAFDWPVKAGVGLVGGVADGDEAQGIGLEADIGALCVARPADHQVELPPEDRPQEHGYVVEETGLVRVGSKGAQRDHACIVPPSSEVWRSR